MTTTERWTRAVSASIEIVWDVSLGEGQAVPDERVASAARAALCHGGLDGRGLAIVFVDEGTLTGMHVEHFDDPSPTDVITFELGEEGQGPIGELYISVDRAREVSQQRDLPFERELLLYVVHGALHLCGFDDHDTQERAQMRIAESVVMKTLGFLPDTSPHEF